MDIGKRLVLAGLAIVAVSGAYASPAAAQASRTWVSGVGDDVNPCSRTAPCKTFAGAISKTAAGGEINCLDPGGFGAVTITKAMTITCDYTGGGLLAAGAPSGVTVNAGAADAVFLSGLDIHGGGVGTPSSHGVRFIAGGALHIQNSSIRMFNGAGGAGISFKPTGAAQLTIVNTVIANNANGIEVAPNGGSAAAMVVDSTIANNKGFGVSASGGSATLRIGNSSITGNATGVASSAGGTVSSYGNNRLHGNAQDGSFSGTIQKQ